MSGTPTTSTSTPRTHGRRGGALQGGAPTPAHAGGHDDGQRLDHLDEAGGEDGEDQDERGGGVHGAGAETTGPAVPSASRRARR